MRLEHADLLFGRIAVRKGFVTPGQIEEAVKIQKERALEGLEHRLLGSLLYGLGYLTVDQIDEIIAEQQKKAPPVRS